MKKGISLLKYGFLSYCKQAQGLKASVVHLDPKGSEGALAAPF